jgi:AcrR family transcriptional regulator
METSSTQDVSLCSGLCSQAIFFDYLETNSTTSVSSVYQMTTDDNTKDKILDACRERFVQEGFASVTVDDIAEELHISKKTFYKHFASKEDVVQQIMERFMGMIRTNVDRIMMSDKSAIEKFSEVITIIATNASRLAPVFGRDIQRRMPQLWHHIEEFRRQRISDIFSRLIRQGIEEGTIRPGMNQRVFLMSLIAAIERIVQPQVLANESFSFGEAIREIMSLFFKGVLTAKGRDTMDLLQSSHSES